MRRLGKLAFGLAVATMGMRELVFFKQQRDMKGAHWFKSSVEKVSEHEGVKILIGTPFKLGYISKYFPSEVVSCEEIDFQPEIILEVPLEGEEGKGNLLLWLNKLSEEERAKETIESWSVGLMEVQIGSKKDNKFVVR